LEILSCERLRVLYILFIGASASGKRTRAWNDGFRSANMAALPLRFPGNGI